jgi:hypothetical protein
MAEVVLMSVDDEPPADLVSARVECSPFFLRDDFSTCQRTVIEVRGFSRAAVEQKHADLLQLCQQQPGFVRECKEGHISEEVPVYGCAAPLVNLRAVYEDRELMMTAG